MKNVTSRRPRVRKLAGHATLTTTMKCMHVAPTRLDAAIDLLDRASGLATEFGETVEKPAPKTPKPGKNRASVEREKGFEPSTSTLASVGNRVSDRYWL